MQANIPIVDWRTVDWCVPKMHKYGDEERKKFLVRLVSSFCSCSMPCSAGPRERKTSWISLLLSALCPVFVWLRFPTCIRRLTQELHGYRPVVWDFSCLPRYYNYYLSYHFNGITNMERFKAFVMSPILTVRSTKTASWKKMADRSANASLRLSAPWIAIPSAAPTEWRTQTTAFSMFMSADWTTATWGKYMTEHAVNFHYHHFHRYRYLHVYLRVFLHLLSRLCGLCWQHLL